MTNLAVHSAPLPAQRRSRAPLALLALGLFVLGSVALAWYLGAFGGQAAGASAGGGTGRLASEWHTVAPKSFDLLVTASGELEAKKQVEVKSLVEGSTTVVDLVEEGAKVEAGVRLIKLADEKITDRIAAELLAVEQARAAKIAAEQMLDIQTNDARTQERAAEVKLSLAKLDLAKWEKGLDIQEKHKLDLELEKAKRTLDRTVRDLGECQVLFKEKFISQSELEDAEIKNLEAKAALETAQLNIAIYQEYTRPKERRKAESDVEQCASDLERTRAKNKSELERLTSDLGSKKQLLAIREDTLAALRDQLAKTEIKSPAAGTVVYATSVGHGRWREPLTKGSQVSQNQTLVIVSDTSQMVAALKVHEALVRQVKEGQRVTIKIDARPGAPLSDCQVSKINDFAEDPGWPNRELRQYMVRVDLPARIDATLKPAMRCQGEIHTGRVENQLAVPVQAVATEEGVSFCWVDAGGGKVRKRPVEAGQASETDVAITRGLAQGERILLRKPRPNEISE